MSVTLLGPPVRSALREVPAGWKVGWWAGGAVVVISAGLLLTIIGLARRITKQADEITAALEATRDNTAPLFGLAQVNNQLDRIVAPAQERS